MAALMLLAASAGPDWLSPTPSAEAAGPPPAKQKVALDIHVAGTIAGSGVELVIRPGNPTCRFKDVVYSVKRDGNIRDIPPIEVETVNADRDCAFAITLKEPGQPDRVFRRSLQINPEAVAASPEKPQVLKVYLNSRTMMSKAPTPEPVNPSPSPAMPRPIAANPAPGAVRKR